MVGALATTGSVMLGHHALGKAGRDVWLAFIAGTAAALVIAALVAAVGVRFPGRTLAEAARRALGRYLGGGFGLAYALYFVLAAIATLRMAMEGLAFALPRTPPLALSLLLVPPLVYAAAMGLQVVAHTSVILLSLLSFFGIILSLTAISVSDYSLLLPLFEHGLRPFAIGTFHIFGLLGEMSVLATVQGRVKGGASFRVNALILLLFFLVTIGHLTGPMVIFGPELTERLTFPIADEIKVLRIPDLLERMDSVGLLLWLMAIALKIPLFLYAAAVEAAHVFSVRDYRLLLLPAGATLTLLSVFAIRNAPQLEEFLTTGYIAIGYVMGIGLPSLLLAVAAVRGGRRRKGVGRLAANAPPPR